MEASGARGVLARYRKIIFAVILFMVADSVVIGINFYNTYKADESAVSINLSGRQRMLSQRMTKVLLLIERAREADDEPGVAENLKELNLTVGLFDTTLNGFRNGDKVTGGDGHPVFLAQVETPRSRQIVEDTYAIWTPYLGLLKPLLGNGRNFDVHALDRAVAYAKDNNLKVLNLMNDLTTDLELVANQRASTLRIVLTIGIIVALINFCYTVIVSLRNLMEGDRQLVGARQETREILETVREGLFLLDKNRKLGTQFSLSLPGMLHRNIEPGMDFMHVLRDMVAKEIYESAVAYIDLLFGERVKESLITSLNPLTEVPVSMVDKLGNVQNRWLSFFFNRVMVDGSVRHLLVTIQDTTEKVLLVQQIEQAKGKVKIEVESLLQLASSDFASLQQFIDNTGQSLSQINGKLSQPHEDRRARMLTLEYIMRLVHTIKGEAAVLGIDALEGYAHACEQEMAAMRDGEQGDGLSGEQMLRIATLLEGFYERYSSLSAIILRLGEALGAQAPDGETHQARTQPFAGQISKLAQRIAADHGKQVEVSCEVEKFSSLPQHIVQELQRISIQLVRNALSHGIETPEERSACKKPKKGSLRLWCEQLGNGLYDFAVRDDGRGIVSERLREHLVQNGRLSAAEASAMSDQEIARFIFQPGVSSAATVDRDAGHGIGLDAVMERVRNINGHLLVKSRPDMFTEFHIQFSTAG
jgi:HPt (histidine-containing phosphotransfer) domain-containing protein